MSWWYNMTKGGCFAERLTLHKVSSSPCLYPGLGFSLTVLQKLRLTPSKLSPGRTNGWWSFESIGLPWIWIEVACDPFFFLCWVIKQVIFASFGSLLYIYGTAFQPLTGQNKQHNFQMKAQKWIGHRNGKTVGLI